MMNATQPLQIANTQLNCAVVLPSLDLTIREAYAFGCPAPFSELASNLGMSTVQAAFDAFQLDQPLTLPGFVALPPDNLTPAPDRVLLTTENFLENVVGQGRLTITPLEIAVMAAAIVNDGNAPTPYTLIEIQRPESRDWMPVQSLHPSLPFMTANTARQIQDMMRIAVAEGAAQNAGRPNIDIGGHATLAYSGNESQAWFTGFATLGGRRGIAIAIVLENSSDPGLAADIGGTVLAIARAQLAAEGS
jgi:peptidoglycan glycosyltransferase